MTEDGSTTRYTLDKTWQEISDAFPNVSIAVQVGEDTVQVSPFYVGTRTQNGNVDYGVGLNSVVERTYTSQSTNDYPFYSEGGFG